MMQNTLRSLIIFVFGIAEVESTLNANGLFVAAGFRITIPLQVLYRVDFEGVTLPS